LGDGAGRTMVRYRTDTYPTAYDDPASTEAYFSTGTSVSITGLIPGTTYYFSAWSEKTGSQQWSNLSVQTTVTTTGVAPPPPPAVGGNVFKISKVAVTAPWLALTMLMLAALTRLSFHIKKRYSRHHKPD
jgi:hypothetical protein